jgi:hypothetical protein
MSMKAEAFGVRIYLLRSILYASLALLIVGCEPADSRRERKRQEKENTEKLRIQSALGDLKDARDFEKINWGGSFTLVRQEYVQQHRDQLYFVQPWNLDAAYIGDTLEWR